VSGSDDKRVLVFDKMTSKRVSDLRGHEDSVRPPQAANKKDTKNIEHTAVDL